MNDVFYQILMKTVSEKSGDSMNTDFMVAPSQVGSQSVDEMKEGIKQYLNMRFGDDFKDAGAILFVEVRERKFWSANIDIEKDKAQCGAKYQLAETPFDYSVKVCQSVAGIAEMMLDWAKQQQPPF